MGTRTKNMKILMSGDTKPYQQSVTQASNKTKQFKTDASGALSSVADAFGVNMGPITSFTDKYTTALKGVYGGLVKSKSGATIWSGAMKIIKLATISTGIGALVIGVIALISYFTKTQRGADKVKQAFAAFGAVVSVITDRFSGLGEKMTKAFNDPKAAVSALWDFIKSQIVNRITGIGDMFKGLGTVISKALKLDFEGAKESGKELGKVYAQVLTGLDPEQQQKVKEGIIGIGNEMRAEAGAAASLEKQLQALRDKEIALEVTQSERLNKIGELRLKAEEKDKYTASQRLAMLDKAAALEKQNLADEKAIAIERRDIMQKQVDLGESMASDLAELATAKANVNNIDTRSLKLQRTLETKRQSVITEINNETAALEKLAAAKNKELGLNADGTMQRMDEKASGITAPTSETVGLKLDNAQLAEDTAEAQAIWDDHVAYMQSTTLDLSGYINDTINTTVVGIGTMLGSLQQEGGGFEAFGSLVGSAMADMAINVGKTAIATGIGVLGIKQALTTLNPAVAIAAGVALVALGTAAKNKLSNIASSSSSSSLSTGIDTTSSLSSASSTSSESTAIEVNITGTLTGSGSALQAVLDSEATRVSAAT